MSLYALLIYQLNTAMKYMLKTGKIYGTRYLRGPYGV